MTEPETDNQPIDQQEKTPVAHPERPPIKENNPPGPPEFRSPIIAERQVGRFEFLYRRPPVSARVARVFVTSSGRRMVYGPDNQPTTGELLWSGIRAMYDV